MFFIETNIHPQLFSKDHSVGVGIINFEIKIKLFFFLQTIINYISKQLSITLAPRIYLL